MFSQIKKIQNMSDGTCIMSPGSCPRGGTLGRWGAQGVKKLKHGHVAYQIDGYDEQNRMQVKFTSKGQTGDLGGEVKMSNIIKFRLPCQF